MCSSASDLFMKLTNKKMQRLEGSPQLAPIRCRPRGGRPGTWLGQPGPSSTSRCVLRLVGETSFFMKDHNLSGPGSGPSGYMIVKLQVGLAAVRAAREQPLAVG